MAQLVFDRSRFDPDTVFQSGQTFRFSRDERGTWRGIAHGTEITAAVRGDTVTFEADGPEDLWRRYTDTDRDYGSLFPNPDDVLASALAYGKGLRVLRQEPFETLISFIISANNNIPRISGIIERICRTCARGAKEAVPFPDPGTLASLGEADLRALGAGYRAPYIIESAKRAADTDFGTLAAVPYEDAVQELLKFKGVGPKVADCIALFGLGHAQAFPVDVWMRRILKNLYGLAGSPKQVRSFAEERFGKHAGIAQQYLFHYARGTLAPGS